MNALLSVKFSDGPGINHFETNNSNFIQIVYLFIKLLLNSAIYDKYRVQLCIMGSLKDNVHVSFKFQICKTTLLSHMTGFMRFK